VKETDRPRLDAENGLKSISDGTKKTLKRTIQMVDNKTNRRDFFRKAAQLTFLSAMVGGSAYLMTENRISYEACGDNQFCKKCQKINTCSLDKAQTYRKNER